MTRVFLGFSIRADWPKTWPTARLLREVDRHITLVFLGEISTEQLEHLKSLPLPNFKSVPAGTFDEMLFLPKRKPRLVAWHTRFLEEAENVFSYQATLNEWLANQGFHTDTRPYLPHVTLARAPFKKGEWAEHFKPIDFQVSGLHCYQSLGYSRYEILWTLKAF